MKLVPLAELFEVTYGVNLELNAMTLDPDGIPFVARSDWNNGVTARVKRLANVTPIPAGTLSVAGGGSVLATFLQIEPYYSGRDLYYLTPRQPMSDAQKLYYAACIRANRYRYNYGRQANRTLKFLKVPALESLPNWVEAAEPDKFAGKDAPATAQKFILPPVAEWRAFTYQDLFKIERGRGPRKNELDGTGTTPFITALDNSNGLTGFTAMPAIHQGNTISVNRNGNGVAEAFYQPVPFCSTEDVHIFIPKFQMTPAIGLFLTALIRREKYRFSYGRKWGIERMKKSMIRLPVDGRGQPNWELMQSYILSLPYSSQIS